MDLYSSDSSFSLKEVIEKGMVILRKTMNSVEEEVNMKMRKEKTHSLVSLAGVTLELNRKMKWRIVTSTRIPSQYVSN
jgi:hypothetical protein